MSISVHQVIVIILFIGFTILNVVRKSNRDNFENIAPLAILQLGVLLITVGVFKIDIPLVTMYAISGDEQKLSIINYISNQQTQFGLIVIGVLLCVLSCIMHRFFSKGKTERLLNIQAYDDNKLEYMTITKRDRKLIEEQYIDLTKFWEEAKGKKSSSPDFKKNIERMTKLVNEEINLFKASSSKYRRSFTGIAPIPLLIYAGRKIPKIGLDRYYEIQKLENKNGLTPLDISDNAKYEPLLIKGNITTSNEKEEVVVAVSTTGTVSNNDLKQFIDKGLEVKHIYLENPSHTSIVSVSQINDYAEIIIKEILDIKNKKENLRTVHLICASKPSLMFRVGQLIDDTQMPVIISYHYTQQDNYKYPWGIFINHHKNEGRMFLWS